MPPPSCAFRCWPICELSLDVCSCRHRSPAGSAFFCFDKISYVFSACVYSSCLQILNILTLCGIAKSRWGCCLVLFFMFLFTWLASWLLSRRERRRFMTACVAFKGTRTRDWWKIWRVVCLHNGRLLWILSLGMVLLNCLCLYGVYTFIVFRFTSFYISRESCHDARSVCTSMDMTMGASKGAANTAKTLAKSLAIKWMLFCI